MASAFDKLQKGVADPCWWLHQW